MEFGQRHRVVSQLLNSGSSALFSIGLVVATDDAELGAIAIQMTALPLLLGVARTGIYESVLLKTSGDARTRAVWLPASAGLTLGLVAALLTALIGVVLDSPWETSIAIVFVSFAVIGFDGLRFSAIAGGRERLASRADGLWLGASSLAVLAVATQGSLTPASMGWSYSIGALVGSTAFLPLHNALRPAPLPDGFRGELRFGWDFVLQAAPGQGALVVGALVSSLSAVGILRAAVTIFSPLATLIYAARLVVIDKQASVRWPPLLVYSSISAIYMGAILAAFIGLEDQTDRLIGAIPIAVLALVGASETIRHLAQALVDRARSSGQLRRVLAARSLQATLLVGLSAALGAAAGATGLAAARITAFAAPLPILRSRRRFTRGVSRDQEART